MPRTWTCFQSVSTGVPNVTDVAVPQWLVDGNKDGAITGEASVMSRMLRKNRFFNNEYWYLVDSELEEPRPLHCLDLYVAHVVETSMMPETFEDRDFWMSKREESGLQFEFCLAVVFTGLVCPAVQRLWVGGSFPSWVEPLSYVLHFRRPNPPAFVNFGAVRGSAPPQVCESMTAVSVVEAIPMTVPSRVSHENTDSKLTEMSALHPQNIWCLAVVSWLWMKNQYTRPQHFERHFSFPLQPFAPTTITKARHMIWIDCPCRLGQQLFFWQVQLCFSPTVTGAMEAWPNILRQLRWRKNHRPTAFPPDRNSSVSEYLLSSILNIFLFQSGLCKPST